MQPFFAPPGLAVLPAAGPRRRPHTVRFTALVTAFLVLWCLTLAALPALAQSQSQPAASAPLEPPALLESARKDLETVRSRQDDTLDDAATQQVRKLAQSAQARAEEAAAALAPQLADVQARLAELGQAPAGVKESPDVAAQRSQLMRSVSTLDSQVKLARLVAVEAEQAAATALANRRTQFTARLGERTPSVTGSRFWKTLSEELPRDGLRVRRLADELGARLRAVRAATWLGFAGAVAVLLLVHAGLRRGLAHLSATRVPAGRLRRSLHALGVVVVRTLTPGLVAHVAALALTSGAAPSAPLTRWLDSLEAFVWFGAFVAALGAALLMPRKPSWRLPPLSDATARRLGWFPTTFATVVVLGWVAARSASALDLSVPATWVVHLLASLASMAVLATALRQLPRRQGDEPAEAEEATHAAAVPAEPLWMATLRTAAWVVLAGSALALLAGYVALGTFVVNQLVWGLIVLSAAYLLAVLVDDLFMGLLAPTASSTGGAAPDGHAAGGLRTREQTAVLLSALCRGVVGFFALLLLLAPYGEGPLELFRRAGQVHEGLSIGQLSVRPTALLQGIVVLLLGFGAVRLLKDWLATRYMPTTRMDAGMRLSVTTLFGYIGGVSVIALAMSAVGVGLERVAWVASALSVGIGFGLQAVVQNFVSGLILLAERPVKVGDWVSLSGVEGDIRRINVRATEIQMGDRSTVIVPNSEFITKIVRNVTYAESLGMVQFKLPLPLATDPERARAVLLAAFDGHPGVLPTPVPNVQLDGIDGTNLILNASGFVGSPRAAAGIKSDLLFTVLGRLRADGLLPGVPAAPVAALPTEPPAAPAEGPTPPLAPESAPLPAPGAGPTPATSRGDPPKATP